MNRNPIFLIESGPALALIKEHIQARELHRNVVIGMQKDLGEDNLRGVTTHRTNGRVLGFSFKSVPKGWSKPNSLGTSRPKNNTHWTQRLAEDKGYPDPAQVISEAFRIPLSIRYKTDDGEGQHCIGSMPAECGWLYLGPRGPFAMWVPDVPAYVKEHVDNGRTVTGPAAKFKLKFPGCRHILDEEWELMVAQDNLKQAKRKKQ